MQGADNRSINIFNTSNRISSGLDRDLLSYLPMRAKLSPFITYSRFSVIYISLENIRNESPPLTYVIILALENVR